MSKKYDDYLKTDYWKAVTQEVKKRADFRCQICNSQHDLCAHHRTYEHRGRELDFLGDLVCLCRRCHATFHGKQPAEVVPKRVLDPNRPKKQPRVRATEEQFAELEKLMPEGSGDIVLTGQLIEQCRTDRGAFTNETVRAFGITGDRLISGWVHRLRETTISRENYRTALRGRYVYNSGPISAPRFLS